MTRPEHLLVDGYNLIKAAPLLRRHEAVSLEKARWALEQALARYARITSADHPVFRWR